MNRRRKFVTAGVAAAAVATALVAAIWLVVVPNWRPSLRHGESYGIDVSRHQGPINWTAVHRDNIEFAYIKATEGGDHIDGRFDANRRAARSAGIRTGSYHFFTFCRSGADQAANFLSVVGDDPESLSPALDLEYAGNCATRPEPGTLRSEISTFIRIVEARTRKPVLLYVLDDTEHRYGVRRAFSAQPLWPRRYPLRPSNRRWVIWQLHGFAKVRGVHGPVDLDVANLTTLDRSR